MLRMRVSNRAIIATLIAASLGLSYAARARASAADFPQPPSLRVAVNFWKNIFGKYSEHQILIVDAEHLGRVYAVLDYRDLVARGESAVTVEQVERAGMADEKEHIHDLLIGLDARQGNDAGLTDEERRIWNLFAKSPSPGKFGAAAEHLQANFAALGSWPLAITAYNHGRAGMMRAVSDTGTTDIGTIVRQYHGSLFGFASRNFYAEFLAAVAVEGAAEQYFGPLDFDTPFRGDEVRLEQALAGTVAASCAATSAAELAVLNPAVDSAVFRGRGNIPRGYLLRVPPGSAGQFAQRLAQIAADARVVPEAHIRAT